MPLNALISNSSYPNITLHPSLHFISDPQLHYMILNKVYETNLSSFLLKPFTKSQDESQEPKHQPLIQSPSYKNTSQIGEYECVNKNKNKNKYFFLFCYIN